MRTTEISAVAVVLIAGICQTEIVLPTSRADESTRRVVDDLVKIVTSCFKSRITAVGLAGHLPDILIKRLSVQHSIPTVLMDNSRVKNNTEVHLVPKEFQYKLQVFIVGASSWNQLTETINRGIRSSIFWNNMASFIILDKSPRCRNIIDYLVIAWLYEILNAKVMCLYRRGWIYNFNPFTRQAPVSWVPVHVFAGKNNHPVTVFEWAYLNNDIKCVDLDFVKTKNLGGYKIIVDGHPKTLEFTDEKFVRTSQEWARTKRTLYTIYRAVNAIPKFTGRIRNFTLSDTEMNMRYSLGHRSGRFAYPYQQFGVVLVSKFKGHKSQLEKIMSITDIYTRIGMIIVYFVTLIFFKFFVQQTFLTAILNLVRMTCDTCFTHITDNTAQRIYLTGLFFFVVIMQIIYQGDLASLLTNKIPYKNINSIEDLVNEDYIIYGEPAFNSLMKGSGLEKRFINVSNPADCIKPVLDHSSAVCLYFGDGYIMDVAKQFDLHLSKEFVAQFAMAFGIKRFWYFEEQINIILGKMMEADIFEPWHMKCSPFTLNDFQIDKEVLENTDYKIIELKEIVFAFVILGIGLLCATVTFVVELTIHRCNSRSKKQI